MSSDSCNLGEEIRKVLEDFKGKPLRFFKIYKQSDLSDVPFYAKIISKLSPIIGNLLEVSVARELSNRLGGSWIRQDPDFPDIVFSPTDPHHQGSCVQLGIEIKTWCPIATEATARFRESQSYIKGKDIFLALIAWYPSYLIYGEPQILDIYVTRADELAKIRDLHYNRPPDNIVVEPTETSSRSKNTQQRVVIGKKLQVEELGGLDPNKVVGELAAKFGIDNPVRYSDSDTYRKFIHELQRRLRYREETNFGKIDRIPHEGLSSFIERVNNTPIHGLTPQEWKRALELLAKGNTEDDLTKKALDILGFSS